MKKPELIDVTASHRILTVQVGGKNVFMGSLEDVKAHIDTYLSTSGRKIYSTKEIKDTKVTLFSLELMTLTSDSFPMDIGCDTKIGLV